MHGGCADDKRSDAAIEDLKKAGCFQATNALHEHVPRYTADLHTIAKQS